MERRPRWGWSVALATFAIGTLLTAPAAHADDEQVPPEPAPVASAPASATSGELAETTSGAALDIYTPTVAAGSLALFGVTGAEPGRGLTAIIATQPQGNCDCPFVDHIWRADATVGAGGTAEFSASVPADAAPGAYFVSVVNTAAGTLSAPLQIVSAVQQSTMTVSPDAVEPGGSVALTIRDFPGTQVRLGLTAPGGEPWWELPTVELGNGAYDGTVVIPSDVPAGDWQIWAMIPDSLSVPAVADLTVIASSAPELSVAPSTAAPGDLVRVALRHFGEMERIRLVLTVSGGAPWWWELGTVELKDGSYDGTVAVPADVPPGDFQMWAMVPDTVGVPDIADITIVAVSTPTVATDSSQVRPGGGLSVTATGFAPGEQVRIELHSTPVVLGSARADATGSLHATVSIPGDVVGDTHELVLIGETSGRSARTALTIDRAGASAVERASMAGGSAQLAATGASDASLAGLTASALVLLAGGVIVRRRRFDEALADPTE